MRSKTVPRFSTALAWSLIAALFSFLIFVPTPCQAYNWETTTADGRDYATLRSFCGFYRFGYSDPHSNLFETSNGAHTLGLQIGSSVVSIDGVHYTLSFPISSGDHDWLVSRMDVIKLFEPVLRPDEIANRRSVKGVVIDPGHGGTDNGASNSRGMEKNYTLDTSFRLERILRDQGLNVVLTRRTDEFVELYERARIAAQYYPNYIFVSIHFNCATEEARGLETYCVTPVGSASTSSAYLSRSDGQRLLGNSDDPQNILLASCVQSEIVRLNPGDSTADRGVKRARFVVIKQNVLPAILVEGGFVSNRGEAALINTEDYRERLAEGIAKGIEKYSSLVGGGHHFSLFGGGNEADSQDNSSPAPVATTPPSTPVYSAKPVQKPVATTATAPKPTTTTLATSSTQKTHGKKKHGSTLASATPTPSPLLNVKPTGTPQVVSSNDPQVQLYGSPDSSSSPAVSTLPPKRHVPLNLADPTPPPASSKPDASNASEPDEPPVQIYQGQSSGK